MYGVRCTVYGVRVCAIGPCRLPPLLWWLYTHTLFFSVNMFSRQYFYVRVVCVWLGAFHQKHIDKEMGGTYFVIFAEGNAEFRFGKVRHAAMV